MGDGSVSWRREAGGRGLELVLRTCTTCACSPLLAKTFLLTTLGLFRKSNLTRPNHPVLQFRQRDRAVATRQGGCKHSCEKTRRQSATPSRPRSAGWRPPARARPCRRRLSRRPPEARWAQHHQREVTDCASWRPSTPSCEVTSTRSAAVSIRGFHP